MILQLSAENYYIKYQYKCLFSFYTVFILYQHSTQIKLFIMSCTYIIYIANTGVISRKINIQYSNIDKESEKKNFESAFL